MTTIINGADLEGLQVTMTHSGGKAFFVSALCPVCGKRFALRLTSHDVETNSQVGQTCMSGEDWPHSFQLMARYSPSETDQYSSIPGQRLGVDVWGEVFESPEREED